MRLKSGFVAGALFAACVFSHSGFAQTLPGDDPASPSGTDSGSRFSSGLHSSLKGFGYVRDDGVPPSRTGYLQGKLSTDLSYDNRFYFHMSGRWQSWQSDDFRTGMFEQTWLSREQFDVAQASAVHASGSDTLSLTDFQELWIKWESPSGDLKIGRQVLNWGEGRFFNPLNVVTSITPYTLEIEEVRGSDSLLYTYYLNGDTYLDVVVTAHNSLNRYDSYWEKRRKYREMEIDFNHFYTDPTIRFHDVYPAASLSIGGETVDLQKIWTITETRGAAEKRGGSSFYSDSALRYRGTLSSGIDVTAIAGWRGRRSFVGGGLNGTVSGAGWRIGAVSFSSFRLDDDGTNRIAIYEPGFRDENVPFVQSYLGFDYTWSRYFSGAVQLFYNGGSLSKRPWTLYGLSQIATDPADRDSYDYIRSTDTTYNPFFFNVSLSGDLTDLITYSLYGFADVYGKGYMGMLGITVSATNDLNIEFGGRLYSSQSNTVSDFSEPAPDAYLKLEYSIL